MKAISRFQCRRLATICFTAVVPSLLSLFVHVWLVNNTRRRPIGKALQSWMAISSREVVSSEKGEWK